MKLAETKKLKLGDSLAAAAHAGQEGVAEVDHEVGEGGGDAAHGARCAPRRLPPLPAGSARRRAAPHA